MRVCLIRHAATAWTESGRIQGRSDVPLSAAGRAQVLSWRLPPRFTDAACLTSPLRRARETACLLGFTAPTSDARLVEMACGAFEGRSLASLRHEHAARMRALEATGVDLRPPGGETPREVAARLADLLRELAPSGGDHVLVTHKGVMRASLVLACGWDMLGRPPARCAVGEALIHRLLPDGRPVLESIISLASRP